MILVKASAWPDTLFATSRRAGKLGGALSLPDAPSLVFGRVEGAWEMATCAGAAKPDEPQAPRRSRLTWADTGCSMPAQGGRRVESKNAAIAEIADARGPVRLRLRRLHQFAWFSPLHLERRLQFRSGLPFRDLPMVMDGAGAARYLRGTGLGTPTPLARARPRPSPWTLTPWRDPTSSRNTDNRTSLNKDPYLGEGAATPTACPRTPKCGADWPRGTFAICRKGPSC